MPAPAFVAGILGSELCTTGLTAGVIRLTANGVTESLPYPAAGAFTLAEHYYFGGDASATDLLEILRQACLAHSQVAVCTVTQNGDGRITVSMDQAFTFLQTDLLHTADLTLFGLLDGIDLPLIPNTPYNFPNRHDGGWFPLEDPAEDTFDELPQVAGEALPVDGPPFVVEIATTTRERRLAWDLVPGVRVRQDLATSDVAPNTFEEAWTAYFRTGRHVRLYPDTTDRATFRTYVFRPMTDGYPWKPGDGRNVWWNVGPLDLHRVD
jgi:hypothetical protein